MATKKTAPVSDRDTTDHTATFVDEQSVIILHAGQDATTSKVGGRYKVNGVWVNANGEPLEDQEDE